MDISEIDMVFVQASQRDCREYESSRQEGQQGCTARDKQPSKGRHRAGAPTAAD